jgi:peptide-methionine (R)-S-oxide reductase
MPISNSLSRRVFFATAATAVAGYVLLERHAVLAAPSAPKNPEGPVTVVQFGDDGKAVGKVTVPRVIKTDAEWRSQLSPLSYDVTRREGTERPYTHNMLDVHDAGLFRCICCLNALFSSTTKFDSGTGWPSFWEPIAKENVVEITDRSFGMARTAVSCRECDAHLGHVFDDGPAPTGLRYCMNAAAMKFVKTA